MNEKKSKLNFVLIILLLIIYSCNNREHFKNKSLNSTSLKTTLKKENETKQSIWVGGTYTFGNDVEKGSVGTLLIYPLNSNSALFYIDLCKGPPSFNLGNLFGKMTIKNNIGLYYSNIYNDDMNCLLKFIFKGNQISIQTGEGQYDCGFGNAVSADRTYTLTNKSIPKYFVSAEADTIHFKGMTVEKYLNRFNFSK